MDLKEIVEGAVGPFETGCDGYGNPGSSGLGSISLLTLDIGVARKRLDTGLETIVAYDRSTVTGTYIGQLNLLQATSFSGVNSAIWGYDLARSEALGTTSPLWTLRRHDGAPLPVHDGAPLFDATRRLLGTRDEKRFPLLPGARVTAAMKAVSAFGPCHIWCALSLAIAEDRNTAASLFLEDMGTLPPGEDPEKYGETERRNLAACVPLIGENQNVRYKEVFVSYRYAWVGADDVAGALAVAPYVVLARRAVPPSGPASILDMTISQWEKAVGLA